MLWDATVKECADGWCIGVQSTPDLWRGFTKNELNAHPWLQGPGSWRAMRRFGPKRGKSRLKSGKYGHANVHIMEKAHRVAADDHTIKEESSEVGSTTLTRNGHVLIQIFNVTESLVIAGAMEINKTVAHSAGSHGCVNRGSASAKQVHFDLTTKLQVDKAFTLLSGNLIFVTVVPTEHCRIAAKIPKNEQR